MRDAPELLTATATDRTVLVITHDPELAAVTGAVVSLGDSHRADLGTGLLVEPA